MPATITILDDAELATRLRNTEDPFVERKSAGDYRDVIKTVVAFANSLPDGVPGVLFIPAYDSGAIQAEQNLDHLQRKISETISSAYPPIKYLMRVLSVGNAEVVTVQVWGSPDRPHFSGPSYVRDGSQTKKASENQFSQLIARRTSKVEELAKWVGKRIIAQHIAPGAGPRFENQLAATLEACNEWYVTIRYDDARPMGIERVSIILDRIRISFDHTNQWLALEINR
jgi:hypothetical protein